MWVVNSTPRPLYPWERPSIDRTGNCVVPRAGLDGCGKFRPPSGIRSPDRLGRTDYTIILWVLYKLVCR